MPNSLDPGIHVPTEAEVDVVVVGAGTAGTSAASAFAHRGYDVALIDVHPQHGIDFRAEKIGQPQMDYLAAFGLGEAASRAVTPFDAVWIHRFGRIVEKRAKSEFGSSYQGFVNALRRGLPPSVRVLVGRVDHISTTGDRQELTLADGHHLGARLVVVATGLGDAVRQKLGIGRVTTSRSHTLALGFDLANRPSDFPFPSLVWNLERPADRAAFFTLFPIGDRMRANLWVYRDPGDPWTQAFRRDPAMAVGRLAPGFERQFGAIAAAEGAVSVRPIDLIELKGYRRPGVVVIGDAFLTTCPSTGTGVDKALCDVDRLLHHAQRWFDTPGMSAEKIGEFYDDPIKQERDANAVRLSWRARSLRLDRGPVWAARRLKSTVVERSAYRLRGLLARPPTVASQVAG